MGSLYKDEFGVLRGDGDIPGYHYLETEPCRGNYATNWRSVGNNFNLLCPGDFPLLGSLTDHPVHFITNGNLRMRIAKNGVLDVYNNTTLHSKVRIGTGTFDYQGMLTIRQGHGDWLTLIQQAGNGRWHLHNSYEQDRLIFYFEDEMGNGPGHNNGLSLWNDGGISLGSSVSIWSNGKVSIGHVNVNTLTDYGLYVKTGILTDRVKVALHTTGQWSDYVFDSNYELMPLEDVALFIKRNGHLPGVPSAECMVEEGPDVVHLNAVLLEKIEELTLHLIRMEAQIQELRSLGDNQKK